MSKTYIVVPFEHGDGKLAPGIPEVFLNSDRAKRAGFALSAAKAGVMVLEQGRDAHSEPRMIWHNGEIPRELFQFA